MKLTPWCLIWVGDCAVSVRSRPGPTVVQCVCQVRARDGDPVRIDVRMDSVFVSPNGPRLRLASEADVLAAIVNGVLGESHYLDLKREVKSSANANKETARDLTSFAIDGGTLIIGIGETDTGIDPTPQPLAGLLSVLSRLRQRPSTRP